MRLAKYIDPGTRTIHLGSVDGALLRPMRPDITRLSDILFAKCPAEMLAKSVDFSADPIALDLLILLAPIDDQEVWGAGVTYERSKVARVEESESGGSFYDLVYSADRPELFFKATPNRVVGPGKAIRVRQDTKWCVPEPELTLVIAPDLRLVGYTIGNDVSARDIEGQNPLYLPQAKVYDACCGLGPWITLAEAMPPALEIGIQLSIVRGGVEVVKGSTSIARMARNFEDLISWLGRDNLFPTGAFLLTGTGVVPPDEFSLCDGDLVHITIDGIGTLSNPVVQGPVIR